MHTRWMIMRARLASGWAAAALGSCAAAGALAEESATSAFSWRELVPGLDMADVALDSPRPMRGTAARIDLRRPELEVVTTPSNGDRDGETDGIKTSTFLERTGCVVAVNAAPFSPIHVQEDRPQDVNGLHADDGDVVSAPGRYPALVVTEDKTARVVDAPVDPGGIFDGAGGFGVVLRDGAVLGSDEPLHPRTAAGVSEDGKTLYLLVLDGRQPGFSEGASAREIGEILKNLGADDGINLDGGGTTAMAAKDPETGKAKLLNRPIHAGIPGFERVAASHLGIRVR